MDAPEIAVEKSTLANGLTLLVAPEHYANVASVQVWCETGSVHEAEWVGGKWVIGKRVAGAEGLERAQKPSKISMRSFTGVLASEFRIAPFI